MEHFYSPLVSISWWYFSFMQIGHKPKLLLYRLERSEPIHHQNTNQFILIGTMDNSLDMTLCTLQHQHILSGCWQKNRTTPLMTDYFMNSSWIWLDCSSWIRAFTFSNRHLLSHGWNKCARNRSFSGWLTRFGRDWSCCLPGCRANHSGCCPFHCAFTFQIKSKHEIWTFLRQWFRATTLSNVVKI